MTGSLPLCLTNDRKINRETLFENSPIQRQRSMRSPEAMTKPAEKRSAAKRSEETVGERCAFLPGIKKEKPPTQAPKD